MVATAELMKRATCMECRISFGLVERHERYPAACVGCVARLNVATSCDACGRLIEHAEWRHDNGWGVLCFRCGRRKVVEGKAEAEVIRGYHRSNTEEGDAAEHLVDLLGQLLHAIDRGDHDSMCSLSHEIAPLERHVGV